MKKINLVFVILIVLITANHLVASDSTIVRCISESEIEFYVEQPESFNNINVPVYIHIIRKNDGTGGQPIVIY